MMWYERQWDNFPSKPQRIKSNRNTNEIFINFKLQVRGLASYKTRFNPPFSTLENACSKSGIWQLLSIRLMCLDFWFCLLMLDFPFLNFPRSPVFLCFYFLHFKDKFEFCRIILKNPMVQYICSSTEISKSPISYI